ncbi:MAG: branched-chain amino acid ABC transporter permease [Candidatus Bathyarchaeia archaeon]
MIIDDLSVIIISTLVSGSIYTLMVIGLTMIFETIRYFNFAHGVYFTFGAYFVWHLLNIVKLDYWVAILLLIPTSFILGYASQRFIIQSLVDREASHLVLILATFCLGWIIESVILLIFGGRLKRLPYPFEGYIKFGVATMSYHKILIFITSTLLLIVFTLILYKTKKGIAMRAIAQEREASYLVGIDVGSIYAITVGLSAILATVGGWLMGGLLFMTPTFGGDILWKGFIVCTLGGRKSGMKGSVFTSYLVAFIETTLMRYLPMYNVPPILFAIVIVALLIRPEGIFVGGSQ